MVISSQAVYYASEIVLPTDVTIIKVVDGVLSYSNTVTTQLERGSLDFPQIEAGSTIKNNAISSSLQTPVLLPNDSDDYDSYCSDYS